MPDAAGTKRLFHKGGSLVSPTGAALRPELVHAVGEATRDLPEGYRAEVFSAADARSTGTKNHPSGLALDLRLVDGDGNALSAAGFDPGLKVYEQLFQSVRIRGSHLYPSLSWIWGGAWISEAAGFGDRMHYQIHDPQRPVSGASTSSGAYHPEAGIDPGSDHADAFMSPAELQSYQARIENQAKLDYAAGLPKAPLTAAEALADNVGEASTTTRPVLVLGSIGAAVVELQTLLGISADGKFGPDTNAAVRSFQASRGLLVDGVVGPQTWGALLGAGAAVIVAADVPHAAEYADRWRRMVILPDRVDDVDAIARRLLANKPRYQAVAAGVPWFFIAILHQRESGADFRANLHNGQPLGQVTTIEPIGRGPFATFEASAADAMKLKGLDKIKDWPIERVAYECERYNGMGYRNKGVPSAYLWSFSNIYQGGKYIADHVWSATAMDAQCGTMPLLKAMMALDASIGFASAPQVDLPKSEPEFLPPLKENEMANESAQQWAAMAKLLLNLAMQSAQSGKPVNIVDLLPLMWQAMSGKPFELPALPAPAVAVEAETKPAAAPVSPIVPAPPVVTASASKLEQPGTIFGVIISGVLAAMIGMGATGTPFGMGQTPTDAGTLAALAIPFAPLLGATGILGKIGGMLGPLIGAIAKLAPAVAPKP